ncbi:translation-associated GTPase [Thalassoglobus neptunius]|uniref:Translation-associated GTPase n=1 Tax=Thalassoglobus neptunius TaxID=1938619 RepID=A0A5C5WY97_9PLAN|nr:TGS domain-containing protein [Thalassoglobus neptunius]TWT55568.1 translation-associated GTPase [Thalassoglobus neptunius]
MAANLTPQYYKAEAAFRRASTPRERLQALEEMLRVIPKHKGTDRIQGAIRARLKELRAELQSLGTRNSAHKSSRFPRQGCGTVVLVGAPNSGKSRVLKETTNATPVVAEYPYSTREAMPGLATVSGVQIQLIDTPAIAENVVPPSLVDLVRTADLVVCCIDGSSPDAVRETLEVYRQLADRKTLLDHESGFAVDDLTTVRIRSLIAITRGDHSNTQAVVAEWKERSGLRLPIEIVDLDSSSDVEQLKSRMFESLGLIRIFTKRPGEEVAMDSPMTIPVGGTVEDLAEKVHHEIASRLKFAKVWGSSAFDGQTVGRDHVLSDGDVVELH